jgi:hypothetical protein
VESEHHIVCVESANSSLKLEPLDVPTSSAYEERPTCSTRFI